MTEHNLRIKQVRNLVSDCKTSFQCLTSKDFIDFYHNVEKNSFNISDTEDMKTTIYQDIESKIYYILGEDFYTYYQGNINA